MSRRNGNEPCHILDRAFINVRQCTVFGSFRGEVKLVLSGRVSTGEALGTISACEELSKLTSERPDKNKAGIKQMMSTGS